MRRYSCAPCATVGSCPIASSRGRAYHIGKNNKAAAKVDTQSPMRVARLADCESFSAIDLATIGKIAKANPEVAIKAMNKTWAPEVTCASARTEYQPSIKVSVVCTANCAIWLPTKGSPKINTDRASKMIAELFFISSS